MTDSGARRSCHEPERRQFDFWLGEWEVCDPDGKVVGHNSIAPLYDGCALREEWRGEEAPVVLANPRLFRPFETLTRMVPLPRYGSIDPTPFMAVFTTLTSHESRLFKPAPGRVRPE